MKAFLFVTDFLDAGPGHIFKDFLGHGFGPPDFAGENQAVRRAERFNGNTGKGIGAKKFIDNGIRYPVADFVRVAFGNRLTGEC